jgi:ubiquinone/menaquinone biosynthesis C-methylase UbiE
MFNGMSVVFKVRDLLQPPRKVLEEVGIKPGLRVLDYGCGPGGYVADAAERVGETICSDCETGLPDNCVDIVLLYDIFHMLNDPQAILAELHRVLKPDGVLSFNDPHMQEDKIIAGVTSNHLFRLVNKGKRTYSFSKQELSR